MTNRKIVRCPKRKRILGYVHEALGGFWRAYSIKFALGLGPFDGSEEAEQWIKKNS